MLYALAPVAFVGGSLADRGGQNPIEAVRHGAAVLTGPNWQNFRDAYRTLLRHKGAIEVRGADDLAAVAMKLFKDERRTRAHARRRGHRAADAGWRAGADGRRRFVPICRPTRGFGVPLDEPRWWYGGTRGVPWQARALRPLGRIYGSRRRAPVPTGRAVSLAVAGYLRRQSDGRRHWQDAAVADDRRVSHRAWVEHPVFLTRGYRGRMTGAAVGRCGQSHGAGCRRRAAAAGARGAGRRGARSQGRRAVDRKRRAAGERHRHGRRLAESGTGEGSDDCRRRRRARHRQWRGHPGRATARAARFSAPACRLHRQEWQDEHRRAAVSTSNSGRSSRGPFCARRLDPRTTQAG